MHRLAASERRVEDRDPTRLAAQPASTTVAEPVRAWTT